MPTPPFSPASAPTASELSPFARKVALAAVTFLFFIWGFMTCLNDILVPHLKSVFELSYIQASLIQFTFFGAYFIMSLPAGSLVARCGYRQGMVLGLVAAGCGALLFYPAAALLSYPLFLAALFVLATGITILQVAANPYVAILGRAETASSRLNLAQAFNSLGTALAPFFGGWLILTQFGKVATTGKLEQAAAVQLPYLGLALTLFLLAGGFSLLRLPVIAGAEDDHRHPHSIRDVLKIPHVVLGAAAIFLYVGAEISVGSYLINFMGSPDTGGFSPQKAAGYMGYFWGGAVVGRFIGSALMQRIRPGTLLAFNAALAALLALLGLFANGTTAIYAVLAIGLFNSIMFPTIFTLGIAGLGSLTSKGSSLLIMAIVGGALVPVLMGHMADRIGIHHSFFIPALCYLYIIYYGLRGHRVRSHPR